MKDISMNPAGILQDALANRGEPVDIVHLTRTPPFATGSFTQIITKIMRDMTAYRQAAVSLWEGPPPDDEQARRNIVLVSRKQLSLWQRMSLNLPCAIRSRLFEGIGGRGDLTYIWQARKALRILKPKVVICYDTPWIGAAMRRVIDWPCRVVLNQQGLSYFMPNEPACRTYSLQSYDSIWTSTHACYRYDRDRMSYYEPVVRVLPNPIDADRFKPVSAAEKQRLRAQWKLPQDRPIVLFLSVLRPKKGAHMLLQAWPQILQQTPDALLWIVGGGEPGYQQYLARMAQSLGVADSVRFEGRVAEKVATCYQAADIYVFSTLFVEGWGLSLSEAMACGLPCVTSESRVTRDIYTEREVLFVPDPNLDGAFADPITRLLQNPELRRQMGATAHSFVTQRFSYEVMLPRWEQAFAREMELIGEPNAAKPSRAAGRPLETVEQQ